MRSVQPSQAMGKLKPNGFEQILIDELAAQDFVVRATAAGLLAEHYATSQSELTYRLRQLGYEITAGRSGAPEIKGYTQEYLDASSPRSQQIRLYLERTGRTGSEAAEIAAHSTRDRKELHSPAEVFAAHRKLAAEFGHQAEAVVRAARERQQRQENRHPIENPFPPAGESSWSPASPAKW